MIRRLQFFSVLLVLLLCAAVTEAQWQRTTGPEGAAVSAIIADGSFVYTATGVTNGLASTGDIYRSSDLGKTWISIGAGIPGNNPVYCLGVNSTALYSGTSSGLFRMKKSGIVWDSISPAKDRMEQILVTDTDIIVSTGFSGIFRSLDDGKTWTKFDLGNLKNATINGIDRIGSTIFLASQGQGIYVSPDNGLSWSVKNDKITGDDLYIGAFTHLNGTEFAATLRGVFFSTDFGNHWDSCRNGLPSEFGPGVFAIDAASSTIYAGVTSMGIFFSTDLGANWKAMNTGIPQYMPTSGLALSSGMLFTGVSLTGVMRTRTDTKSWELATTGIANTSIGGMLQFTQGNTTTMFAGASDNDFGLGWRSTDKGDTWQSIDSMTDRGVTCFGAKDGTIFAGTFGDGIYTSSDGGVKWISRGLEIPGASYISAITSTPTSIIAAITGTVGVICSTDLGVTWTTPLASGFASINAAYYDSVTHTVFVGSNFGLFTSSDDGVTWLRPKSVLDSVTVYSFARVGNTLLAGSWFGVYHSTDNGVTWSIADQITKNTKFISLYVLGGIVYAAVHGEVLVSNDQGLNWQTFGAELPKNVDVGSLSSDGVNLYAGTIGYGVWKTPLPSQNTVRNEAASSNTFTTIYSDGKPSLRYTLSSAEHVHIKLISVTGENLFTVCDEMQSSGSHEIPISDAMLSKLAAGIYFAEMSTNDFVMNSKILVRK